MTFLYHIRRNVHSGLLKEGYVGISDNPKERIKRHFAGYSGSPILKNALSKYNDISWELISEGTREEMLELEQYFRPCKMAWNACEGGGDPPNHSGKVMSESQKRNIGLGNGGVNNYKWKGWWIVDGVEYASLTIAASLLNVSKRTVRNRCFSPKFSNWNFKEKHADEF